MKASKTYVIAHRGASAEAPENSLAAFMISVEQGCDMIELDVHLTKDQQVVVIHDAALERTTNGSGVIAELNYDQIKKYDCGSWFDAQYAGQYIPLLEEVLTTVPEHVQINVEVKAAKTAGMIDHLIEVLRRTNRAHQVVISSFDYDCLQELKQKAADIRVGLLYDQEVVDFRAYEQQAGLEVYSLHPHYRLVTEAYMMEAKAAGKTVYPWTVDAEVEIHRLIDLQVDGIITNKPSLLKKLLELQAYSSTS